MRAVPEMSLKQFLRCPSNSSWDVPQTVPEMSPKQFLRCPSNSSWDVPQTEHKVKYITALTNWKYWQTNWPINLSSNWQPVYNYLYSKLDTVQWPPLASGGQTGHCTVTPFGQWWSNWTLYSDPIWPVVVNDCSRSTSFTEQWQLQEHKFHGAMTAPGAQVSQSNDCSRSTSFT